MEYNKAVELFMNYAELNRGYAVSTLEVYKRILLRFAEDRINKIEEITLDVVDNYILGLKNRGISTNGIFNDILCIRAFLKFLKRKGYKVLDYDLIDVPKRKIKPVYPLKIEEIQALLENMHRERDRLMLLIMFTSGIRVNELINLKVEDWDRTSIRVIGKGSKIRLCYIHEYVAQRLLIYTSMENINSGYIFRSSTGKPLHAPAVRYVIRNSAKRAGIEKRIYPHLMRHTFSAQYLENGGDVRSLQALLGHDQIQTTMRYMNITDLWKKEQYDKHKPKIVLTNPSLIDTISNRIEH
jgi:integrase/recombinase XerD